MKVSSSVILLGLGTILAAGPLAAQSGPPRRPMQRMELEAELQRGFTRAVRQQVGLTDPQMRQLSEVTQRYAAQRRQLQMREREVRTGLQRMLASESPVDSSAVAHALTQLIATQKRRVELMEGEQRDLAAFMTPIQRARFMALQEQMRRRLEQRRSRRVMEERGGPPPGR
jgi:periplasmic protein CpxP/Spy